MENTLIWMILLPLVGSVFNGLVLRTPYPRRAGVIATAFAGGSLVMAILLFAHLCATHEVIAYSIPWFHAGSLHLNWGFRFDSLTACMCLVVTGIGSVIHLYSIGYMSEDRTPYRFFSYLNLFLFAMLTLVTASSLPVLFVGWEGVGVCSYLLIGYWYADLKNANAGIKAFIVNRIGDAGFLLGIFLCFTTFRTLEFDAMNAIVSQPNALNLQVLNLIGLFLFIGAMGKSAQIPLYVWLPDAMAGPTPVSALIHAATMVTAGIYLILRMHFLFQVTTGTNLVIAVIGGMTSLLAALIATSQNDIKKVLAYSTVSQLGLMVLGLGCQAYFAAFFHLVTHAFFKALLFLGAGSVIHGLHGEQDLTKMGGLRKQMPATFTVFTIGTLAIAGIPPLSGFFSKDTLLYGVSAAPGGAWFWAIGSVTSALTAFYMARLYALAFFGRYRGPEGHPPHESPAVMTLPLFLLAVGAVLAGFIGMPSSFHFLPNYLAEFLEPVIGSAEVNGGGVFSEFAAMGIASAVAIGFTVLGILLYRDSHRAEKPAGKFGLCRTVFANKFWVDELYEIVFIRPFEILAGFFAKIFDTRVIDTLLIFPSRIARAGGTCLSLLQTGATQSYLLVMLLGGLAILWACLKGASG